MLIGRLARLTGVPPRTLRFYEAEGLLPEPDRTPAGYRDYPEQAGGRVGFIRQAQAAGLTLAQIRDVLAVRDAGEPPCRHVAAMVEDRLDEITSRLRQLERTRGELVALRDRLARLDPADCHEDAICAAVERAG